MQQNYKFSENPDHKCKMRRSSLCSDGDAPDTYVDFKQCEYLQNDILATDCLSFDADAYINKVQFLSDAIVRSNGELISCFFQKEMCEKLFEILVNAENSEVISKTLDFAVELGKFSDEFLHTLFNLGIFGFAGKIVLDCEDVNLILSCLKVLNISFQFVDSSFDPSLLINSFVRFCSYSNAIVFQIVQAIFLIIFYIDFGNVIDNILDLIYMIFKKTKMEKSRALLMECLCLLIRCDDKYFKKMFQRKIISKIVKIFNNYNHIETTSGFITPFLKFLTHSIYILNERDINVFLSKIALGPGMQNLFRNEKIADIKVWILDIYQQIIQKEIDMELHYTNLMEYLIQNQFIQELFEIFPNCNFTFKAKIIDFLRLLMSTKYETIYSLFVSNNINYFNVCCQFCLSSTNYDIMKNFLETIICILKVSENLDEKELILEMMDEEEVNDQLERYVNNQNEIEIMRLSEQYFNQTTLD